MSPVRTPSASTSGSFLTFCSIIMRSAESSDGCVAPRTTTSRSTGVIRSETFAEPLTKRMSRSVSNPRSRRLSSTTTSVPTPERSMTPPACSIVTSGPMVYGIGDDPVLRALDDLDFAHLRLDLAGPEAPVDDPEAALFRLHDRHRRPRHRIHVGRDDGPLERQVLGKARGQVDLRGVAPLEDAVLGGEAESRRTCSRGQARRERGRTCESLILNSECRIQEAEFCIPISGSLKAESKF